MKKDNSLFDPMLMNLQQRASAGDENAFRDIYIFFYKKLYRFALAIVKTKESAEEITEDVFEQNMAAKKEDLLHLSKICVFIYILLRKILHSIICRKKQEKVLLNLLTILILNCPDQY